ncbi:hypothetical protein BLNAU_3043 [Blattamonas nauphoetae]|uniref:Uncharacterized protein n=1 Tax=Blattamonas nauphoetae TaxID=2049346 RepID=A0ABQ9YE23_9EUKA|nr:hypothetical protein BLNAU_3043 [Blattamonas nauphoetae]
MPPKHKLGRKHSKTQSDTRTQSALSSISEAQIVDSTIQNTIENDNESSLDLHSISSATDVVTITVNDRHYVRVSKRILPNELKQKRISVEPMLEQAHLEGDEISLPTSTTSDWRLVLQDSITLDDLQQGCLSLFDQVNSKMNLASIEVFHAVNFLEYTTIHIKYREYPHQHLLETIFSEEVQCQTKLTSALIKLVCHPSDKLRTAALSFFDVGISRSSPNFTLAMAYTGMLPELFESLKPHEIPINGTTIEFHRHITSIVDKFFDCPPYSFGHETISTKHVDLIFKPFCNYLRHLIASPACPPDYPSGISLLSKMETYDNNITYFPYGSCQCNLEPIFDEL